MPKSSRTGVDRNTCRFWCSEIHFSVEMVAYVNAKNSETDVDRDLFRFWCFEIYFGVDIVAYLNT